MFWKGVVLKLSSLISPKLPFFKTTESELFEPYSRKYFIDATENTFLRKEDTYVKLISQKIFLKMCRSQTMIFDLCKTGIPENKGI